MTFKQLLSGTRADKITAATERKKADDQDTVATTAESKVTHDVVATAKFVAIPENQTIPFKDEESQTITEYDPTSPLGFKVRLLVDTGDVEVPDDTPPAPVPNPGDAPPLPPSVV